MSKCDDNNYNIQNNYYNHKYLSTFTYLLKMLV